MMRRVTAFVALATWGTALAGEQADFAVPLIGHVYDTSLRQLRPITGTPGAATVGTGTPLAAEKALAPGDGSFAIVSSADADALQLIRANGESQSIPGASPLFDKGQLSAGGGSALIYAAACHCVSVVSGLRESPEIKRTITLSEGADVRALSVTDDGTVIAIAIRTAGGSRVLIYSGSAETPSAELELWADAVALDASGQRLLVVETALRKAHIVSNLEASPALDEILTEREGLASPSAAAFGANGTVLISDADAGVFLWNEADRTVRRIECACKPEILERAATSNMYRLSNLEQGAVWLFDASSESPRTFFVPAPRAEAAQ